MKPIAYWEINDGEVTSNVLNGEAALADYHPTIGTKIKLNYSTLDRFYNISVTDGQSPEFDRIIQRLQYFPCLDESGEDVLYSLADDLDVQTAPGYALVSSKIRVLKESGGKPVELEDTLLWRRLTDTQLVTTAWRWTGGG